MTMVAARATRQNLGMGSFVSAVLVATTMVTGVAYADDSHTESHGAAIGGGVLIGLGSAAITATPFMALGAFGDCFLKAGCFSPFEAGAIVMGISGLVLTTVGIVLVAMSTHAHVDRSLPQPPPTPLHTTDSATQMVWSPVPTFTVLHGSF